MFKNNLTRKWFFITCAFAFLSVVSFFHVNSYWAEFVSNGFFVVLGIVFALCAGYGGYNVWKYGYTPTDKYRK